MSTTHNWDAGGKTTCVFIVKVAVSLMYFLLYSEAHEVALKLLKPVLYRSSGSEVWDE